MLDVIVGGPVMDDYRIGDGFQIWPVTVTIVDTC